MKLSNDVLVTEIPDEELVQGLRISGVGRGDLTTIYLLEFERRQNEQFARKMCELNDASGSMTRQMLRLTWAIAGMTLLNVVLVAVTIWRPL